MRLMMKKFEGKEGMLFEQKKENAEKYFLWTNIFFRNCSFYMLNEVNKLFKI